MGACSPNYKLSIENEEFMMNYVIYPLLDYLEMNSSPYIGILGVNGILTEDGNIKILGFQNFMQDADSAGVLELLDEDVYTIFEACVIGSFSDEYEFMNQKDYSATSIVLNCRVSEKWWIRKVASIISSSWKWVLEYIIDVSDECGMLIRLCVGINENSDFLLLR